MGQIVGVSKVKSSLIDLERLEHVDKEVLIVPIRMVSRVKQGPHDRLSDLVKTMLAYFGNSFAICHHDNVIPLQKANKAKYGVCLGHLTHQAILLLLLGHKFFHLLGVKCL